MPRRRFFRSQITGRFISEAQASEEESYLYTLDTATGERSVQDSYEYFHPEEEEEAPQPFWEQADWERGVTWRDFDPDADHDLEAFAPPDGVNAFRVFVDVADNPDYPRGKASSGWMDMSVWPPSLDMIRGVDPSGFHEIRFRRG